MKTLPDSIRAIRRLNYDAGAIAEAFEDDEQTLENVIDMAIDYAVEDLNNSTLNFYVEAEWLDANGNVVKVEEYDEAGNFVRAHGVLVRETTDDDDEINVEFGTTYVDPDAGHAYICSVANNIKTMHVVVVNGSDRPVFKVLDDEGVHIEPSYQSLDLAITVAKGWLS